MFEAIRNRFGKRPEYVSPFSEFIRNASSREKKKVFEQVMKEAIEEQRKVMERAEQIQKSKDASGPNESSTVVTPWRRTCFVTFTLADKEIPADFNALSSATGLFGPLFS